MGCCASCFQEQHDGRTVSDHGGHRLGGDGPTGERLTAEQRREQQQRALEQRQLGGGGKGSNSNQKPTNKAKPPRSTEIERTQQDGSAAERAANAAEERARNVQGISGETAEAMRERRLKEDLIGRITANYNMAGQDAPFGLAACSMDALKRQLEYSKGLKKAGAVARS